VWRGGAWNNNHGNARAACRNNNHPDNRNNEGGVRCVSWRPTSLSPFQGEGFHVLTL